MRTIGKIILGAIFALPYVATALRFVVDRLIGAPGVIGDAQTWLTDWLPEIREAFLSVQTEPAAWFSSTLALVLGCWLIWPEIAKRLRSNTLERYL